MTTASPNFPIVDQSPLASASPNSRAAVKKSSRFAFPSRIRIAAIAILDKSTPDSTSLKNGVFDLVYLQSLSDSIAPATSLRARRYNSIFAGSISAGARSGKSCFPTLDLFLPARTAALQRVSLSYLGSTAISEGFFSSSFSIRASSLSTSTISCCDSCIFCIRSPVERLSACFLLTSNCRIPSILRCTSSCCI